MTEPEWIRPCHGMCPFYLHRMVTTRIFSPTFPPMGSTVGAFYWLFLWNFKGSVMVYGCFISTVRWKIRPFFQFSPWRDPRLRHFAGYPFGTSRKKASTIFYNTAISKGSVIAHGCFVSSICWRYITFFQFFRWWTPWLGDFIGYFLGISRNKASAVFYDTAFQNTLDSAVSLI